MLSSSKCAPQHAVHLGTIGLLARFTYETVFVLAFTEAQ